MLYFSLIAAAFILACSIGFAIANRHNSTKFTSILVAGIFLTTVLLVLPTDWVKDKNVTSPFFFSLVSSVFYSFEVLGGAKEIAQLETIKLSGGWKALYIAANYIVSFCAPFITSGLILSLFGDVGEKIRKLLFKWGGTCHVFSSLNQNTLTLAKGIKKSGGCNTFVFCNTKNCDKAIVESARKIGGITLYKNIPSFKPSIKHKHFSYYLLNETEDQNINDTIALLQVEKIKTSDKVTINSFAHSDCNISIVESLDRGNARLYFVNQVALFVNNLMFEHPLYNLPDGCRDISVAVIGLGTVGLQTIKTAVWCGQIEGYTLRIRAFDKSADVIESRFYYACPELKNYDIKFINADIQNADFEDIISDTEREDGAKISYVVIATEDDNLNIITADNIRKTFIRLRENYTNFPQIHTRVRSLIKSSNLLSDADYLKSRNIDIFGNIDGVYSKETLFNTRLEKLAFAVHLCYCGQLDAAKDSAEYQNALDEFLQSEYNRRSSTAVALHIYYKIKSATLEKSGCDYETLIKENADFYERLAQNEHERWNAYMRSEGWRSASLGDMEKFYKATKSTRDDVSKSHPCITSWDELEKVDAKYFELTGKAKNHKEYDYMIVEKIPEIIKKAGEL